MSEPFLGRRPQLYQIAYSDATWNAVPACFLALDNRSNERPDWAEYWPIRRFLMNETLDENILYGFLSPRVTEKLQCSAEEIQAFVASAAENIDFVAFSPYIDLRALFRNVFEQGEFMHPGHMDICCRVVKDILPGVDLRNLVNTVENAVYCNYFAAKPRFWRKWLAICERIFALSESPKNPLAARLNRAQVHSAKAQEKVFVIERVASLLLATSSEFNCTALPQSTFSGVFPDLSIDSIETLQSLKSQAALQRSALPNAFFQTQDTILNGATAIDVRRMILATSLEKGIVRAPSAGYERWGGPPAGMLFARGQISAAQFLKSFFSRQWRRSAS
jgi:hypothetical protein